jgi:periplasmic protein CpxP/Spy
MLKQSKNLLAAVLLLCSLITLSTNGLAEENKDAKKTDAPAAKTQTPARPRVTPEQRLNTIAEKLGLNDEQKTKLKAVFDAESKALRDLRADTSVSDEDRRSKMRQIRQESNEKINAFLTDEQKTKYKDMQKEVRQAGNRANRPNRPPKQ